MAHVRVKPRAVWSLAEARAALERLIGVTEDWGRLDTYLIAYAVEPAMRATAFASSLAATLEMVREGVMDLHQQDAFGPILVRRRTAVPATPGGAAAANTNNPQ